MRSLIEMGRRRDEILDLTAPAKDSGGLVARWLSVSLASLAPEPAQVLRQITHDPAA